MRRIMASKKSHCKLCKKKLGEPYEYVHEWLDAMAHAEEGMIDLNHRRHRHHQEGVEEVRRRWGDEAAEAAIIHIKQDMGTILTEEQAKKYLPQEPRLMSFREFKRMMNKGIRE